MKKLIWNIKTFYTGMKTGVDYWQLVMFDRKIPRIIAWILAIVTIPINIIVILVGSIFNRNYLNETYEEVVLGVMESKEEA